MWSTDPAQNPAFHDFARVENRLKIIIKSISGLCSLLLKWPVCWNKRSLRWDQGIQLPRQIHCQGKCGLEFSQKCCVTRISLKTEKYISSRQLQKTLSHGRTTWSRCRHFCFGSYVILSLIFGSFNSLLLSGCILSPGFKPCFFFRWFSTALLRAPSEWPSTVTLSQKSWNRNSRMWMWVHIAHTLSCKWYDALFLSHALGSEYIEIKVSWPGALCGRRRRLLPCRLFHEHWHMRAKRGRKFQNCDLCL